MKPEVILKKVSKNYGELKIVENISFKVMQNEFVSIIGPSGCGKTTLLYLIERLIEKSNGEINIFGKKGFVFQDHNLFPWKTVKENISIGPINQEFGKAKVRKIVKKLIEDMELSGFENYYPSKISEGMKQRVGIARALANNPEILLMDEPFGSLDYLTRLKMQDFILNLLKKRKLTILFVTHDVDEAIKLSDRIIVLSKRPAKIIEIIEGKNFVNKIDLKNKILNLIN